MTKKSLIFIVLTVFINSIAQPKELKWSEIDQLRFEQKLVTGLPAKMTTVNMLCSDGQLKLLDNAENYRRISNLVENSHLKKLHEYSSKDRHNKENKQFDFSDLSKKQILLALKYLDPKIGQALKAKNISNLDCYRLYDLYESFEYFQVKSELKKMIPSTFAQKLLQNPEKYIDDLKESQFHPEFDATVKDYLSQFQLRSSCASLQTFPNVLTEYEIKNDYILSNVIFSPTGNFMVALIGQPVLALPIQLRIYDKHDFGLCFERENGGGLNGYFSPDERSFFLVSTFWRFYHKRFGNLPYSSIELLDPKNKFQLLNSTMVKEIKEEPTHKIPLAIADIKFNRTGSRVAFLCYDHTFGTPGGYSERVSHDKVCVYSIDGIKIGLRELGDKGVQLFNLSDDGGMCDLAYSYRYGRDFLPKSRSYIWDVDNNKIINDSLPGKKESDSFIQRYTGVRSHSASHAYGRSSHPDNNYYDSTMIEICDFDSDEIKASLKLPWFTDEFVFDEKGKKLIIWNGAKVTIFDIENKECTTEKVFENMIESVTTVDDILIIRSRQGDWNSKNIETELFDMKLNPCIRKFEKFDQYFGFAKSKKELMIGYISSIAQKDGIQIPTINVFNAQRHVPASLPLYKMLQIINAEVQKSGDGYTMLESFEHENDSLIKS